MITNVLRIAVLLCIIASGIILANFFDPDNGRQINQRAMVGGFQPDFLLEVNKGNVEGYSIVNKFGANNALGVVEEDIWSFGGIYPFPEAYTVLEIFSDNAFDDFTPPSAGARSLLIRGLGTDFGEIEETISLNGLGSVFTTQVFSRVNRAFIVDVGVYGANNVGNIVIQQNSGGLQTGDTIGYILAGDGQTSQTHFTIPDSKTGFVLRSSITVDSTKPINVNLNIREDADDVIAPFSAKRVIHHWKGLSMPVEQDIRANHILNSKTDIWYSGQRSGGVDAVVDIDYDILIKDD